MWTCLIAAVALVGAPVGAPKKKGAQKKTKAPIAAPVATPAPAAPAPIAPPTAQELLLDSDRARGGLKDGITWIVDLRALEDGETLDEQYLVKARDNDSIAEALAPPRRKGEVMLFNDRTLWFFKPGLRKPVSISARQKLTGDAVTGDIATTRYARDYEGKVVGRETIDGIATWRLDLTARAPTATYDRIRYWISVDRHLGVVGDFLTVSGEVLKQARFVYGNTVRVDGKDYEFVSEMTITDPNAPDNKTVLKFGPPRAETHSATLFNINNLLR